MNEWILGDRPVMDEDLIGFKAFVYLITNLTNGKKYIGKKRLQFIRRKRVKGRKNRIVVTTPSDYQTYWGSSDELNELVQSLGEQNFKREILRLCRSLSEANYYELREQMVSDALLHPESYYNKYVGSRISRKQMGVKEL